MSKDLSQEIENAEESIEKLKSKEFRVLGFKVTFISISALAAIVGSILGGLYGAFEVYKDYMEMKEQIQSYVAPDLSGLQEQMSVLSADVGGLKEISSSHVKIIDTYGDKLEFMQTGIEANEAASRDMKNNMREDISRVEKIVDNVEDDMKKIEGDVRESIQNAEERFENKRDGLQNDYDEKANRLSESNTSRMDELNNKVDRNIARMENKIESEMKDLEDRLGKKLQRALDNPLAN